MTTVPEQHDELRLLAYAVAGGTDIGLRPDDFVADGYKAVFAAWREARGAGLVEDLPGLLAYCREHLGSNEQVHAALESVGQVGEVAEKAAVACLRSSRLRRRKIQALEAVERFKASLSDPFSTIEEESNRLHEELSALIPPPTSTIGEEVAGIVHGEMDAILNDRKLFFPTGLPAIDNKWGGVSNEGVTLILARSGHGKTTLANRLYFGLCCNGFQPHLHGTETSKEQRLRDLMYSMASLNQIEARATKDKDYVVGRLNEAARMLASFTGTVTGAGLTLDEICTQIRVGVMAGTVDVAIIDYVQDVAPSGSELRMPRAEFVGKVSQAFKDLAAELHIPIIIFAQANKPLLKDALKNPRPGMYDAQWSSKLPQDAEEVYVMYNDAAMIAEYGDAWRAVSLPGCIELIKRKARRTALGGVELAFHGDIRWLGDRVPL